MARGPASDVTGGPPLGERPHPLLKFVSIPDASYHWALEWETPLPSGATLSRLRLVSQTWQGAPWQHELNLVRPRRVREGGPVLLKIAADRGDAATLALAAELAHATGLPAGVLFDIPNQPLFDGRSEDALIAFTFGRFLESGEENWPLLFPMTKSVVRAMDAIQAFAARRWEGAPARFLVTGASKRGWTTWLTGAVDPRVIGIAPMVYDNLNLHAQMALQLSAYGGYSEAIADYTELDLQRELATPRGRRLVELVDPYALRDRLELPKLLIHGTNDPYWTLESAGCYLGGLSGPKHLLYVPNGGHGLGQLAKAAASVGAFALARAAGEGLPELAWSCRETRAGLELSIRPGADAEEVSVWTATSQTRDFRQAGWERVRLPVEEECGYVLRRPEGGFAAILGEVVYRGAAGPYCLTTLPRVVPTGEVQK